MNRRVVVGDRVTFRVGLTCFDGEVVEECGRVGVNGRRLVRVRFLVDGTVSHIELPARDLDLKEVSA